MANFGKIKTLAKKKGVSLHDVARAIEITPTGLSTIIRNNSTTNFRLKQLADYFDVSVDYFLNEDTDDNHINYGEELTPADKIREEMRIQGITGKSLAEKLGFSQQRLWYMLNEAQSIKEADLSVIANALDMDVKELRSKGSRQTQPILIDVKRPEPVKVAATPSTTHLQQTIADLQRQLNESQRTIADLASANRALSEQLYGGRTPAGYIPSKRNPNDPF